MEENEKEIRSAINELQKKLVELIWQYCKNYHPNAETANFAIDGLFDSMRYDDNGYSTDSSIVIYDKKYEIIIENI